MGKSVRGSSNLAGFYLYPLFSSPFTLFHSNSYAGRALAGIFIFKMKIDKIFVIDTRRKKQREKEELRNEETFFQQGISYKMP